MRLHNQFHAGYEMVAAHQARLREERSLDRLARQAATEVDPAHGLWARAQHMLLHSRTTTALVICVPLLYALNAPHVAAQRAPSHAAPRPASRSPPARR